MGSSQPERSSDLGPSSFTLHVGGHPEKLRALAAVELERAYQDGKWGLQSHDDYRWCAILAEEFGEAAQSLNHAKETGTTKPGRDGLYHELAQVAAVAVAWMEHLDRRSQT